MNNLKETIEGNSIPTCYLARHNDIIVLEDLSNQGFKNVPLLDTFSLEQCKKAIDSLAKLHAASIIYELKHNCKIDELIPILKKETVFSKDENNPSRKSIFNGINALRALKDIYLPNYPKCLTNEIFDYMIKLVDNIGPFSDFLNVFSHSDLWENNIMFSYDKEQKVKNVVL